TNGGYRFTSFKWYKNGQLISTGQYYSAGENASDRLDPNASYSVELTTTDNRVLRTCEFNIELNSAFALTASPNPVRAGSTIEVVTNYSDNMLNDRIVQITSLYGAPILRQVSASNGTTITLPNSIAPGTYVVTTVASGVILTTKIIVQ
uniref:T9SS type A sorting domain-containing protein n=1 Tax=uncultured Sunxiuqinia sp. TaxID=1573825 RepID=UPI0030DC1231